MDTQKTRFSQSPTQVVGIVFLLLGTLSFLFIPVPSHTFLWKAVNNFAHVPLFGIVAILLLYLSRRFFRTLSWPSLRHYLGAIMGVLVLALLTEALQSFTATRQFEMSDILHDFIGATCGLGLFFTYDSLPSGKWAQWEQFPRNAILRFCVILLLSITLVPLMGWTYAFWDRANRFPSILQFSSEWEMKFVRASSGELQVVVPPDGWGKSVEDMVGRVGFQPNTYSGVRIEEPYPDWRGFSIFQLDIFSDLPTPKSVVIRIHDQQHNNYMADRFNKTLIISPGLNQIRIPIEDIRQAPVDREMDLSAIRSILVFANKPPEEFTLYLDDIRLE